MDTPMQRAGVETQVSTSLINQVFNPSTLLSVQIPFKLIKVFNRVVVHLIVFNSEVVHFSTGCRALHCGARVCLGALRVGKPTTLSEGEPSYRVTENKRRQSAGAARVVISHRQDRRTGNRQSRRLPPYELVIAVRISEERKQRGVHASPLLLLAADAASAAAAPPQRVADAQTERRQPKERKPVFRLISWPLLSPNGPNSVRLNV
ncbi:S-adenosylmethionine synthase [Frankliniella fusca]|uniref:S-adenosylmethionine synthase n=1 Tax=Frankliniella fusca TaxID=407009 RepID=A0AAE1LBC4_9NEOP|nr:S-adenosylmethionine synthase [Frankliniella fusca]